MSEDDKRYVLAFSGGKDSTYLLYELLQRKMRIDEIRFYDVSLEFPEVYAWLEHIEKRFNVKITRYPPRPGFGFKDGFYKKTTRGRYEGIIRGFPRPCVPGCWINRDAKVRNCKHGPNEITYLAICANENKRKQQNPNLLYPLIDWGITESMVIERLKALDLFPYYYAKGFTRGGCWLCPKQSKKSLFLLWKHYPDLWAELKRLEAESPHGFRPTGNLTLLEEEFRRQDHASV
jgi:3'-phosphoadenosine 5'-phosphosulfate sulfotransferase (PAPS reductase)/FAD synthetase